MLNTIFQGLFDSTSQSVISIPSFLLCIGVSLAIGIFLAGVYAFRSRYTKSFMVTLALLPAIVCVVIMMVNGNIGAGVAVAGAFSLVRFRSVPGTAREIGMIFLAMGSGLIAGMGYLAYAGLFSLVLGLMMALYQVTGFGEKKSTAKEKTLRITIPEDLDYTNVFNDILEQYTQSSQMVSVKTSNMGSLFKVTYQITLRDPQKEKEMIDALRCRNGNLEITLARQEVSINEL